MKEEIKIDLVKIQLQLIYNKPWVEFIIVNHLRVRMEINVLKMKVDKIIWCSEDLIEKNSQRVGTLQASTATKITTQWRKKMIKKMKINMRNQLSLISPFITICLSNKVKWFLNHSSLSLKTKNFKIFTITFSLIQTLHVLLVFIPF